MSMISFWRHGFGVDASWEVHHAPSGDYRITICRLAEARRERPSHEDESWMKCRISEIVHFATPYTVFALDTRAVQALLDIHSAVYLNARHPPADELLRQRHYGEYLRALGDDLARAVTHHLLRVEKIERPWPFAEKEEHLSRPPPAQAAGESIAWVAFRLVDQDGEPVPRRRFVLTGADKDEREGFLTSAGRERFERMAPGECKLVFGDFDVSDFSEPRALPGKRTDDGQPVKSEGGGTIHVVKHEDTPWSIAGKYAFENFETIWNAAENKGLREKRENLIALIDGDELVIPEKKPKPLTLATGKETSFTVYIAKRRVRVWLLDHDGQRVPVGTPYRFTAGEGPIQRDGKTIDAPDGKGGSILIEERIPAKIDRAIVEWGGTAQSDPKPIPLDPDETRLKSRIEKTVEKTPFLYGTTAPSSVKLEFPNAATVRLGILDGMVAPDPVVEARLHNLALFDGALETSLARFAREYGLDPSLDDAQLRAQLRDAHRDGEPRKVDTSQYGDWESPNSDEVPV